MWLITDAARWNALKSFYQAGLPMIVKHAQPIAVWPWYPENERLSAGPMSWLTATDF